VALDLLQHGFPWGPTKPDAEEIPMDFNDWTCVCPEGDLPQHCGFWKLSWASGGDHEAFKAEQQEGKQELKAPHRRSPALPPVWARLQPLGIEARTIIRRGAASNVMETSATMSSFLQKL
jgi:hypothetical protein